MTVPVRGSVGRPRDDDGGGAPAGGIPETPPDLLDRFGLYERLDAAGRVAVLQGRTGAGKSTLLAAWARRQPAMRTVLWLAPEEAGSGLRAAADLARTDVIVIDGVCHDNAAAVVAELTRVVSERPELRAVLGFDGRVDPAAALWQPLCPDVVGAGALVMTEDDVVALAGRSGVELGSGLAGAVYAVTEGWAGAVEAAVTALHGATEPGRAGEHAREAAEEYARGVAAAAGLTGLAPCALVDAVDAALARELTGDPAAADLLARAEASGLAESEIVDGEPVYRISPPLRRALVAGYERHDPAGCRAAHRRAGTWYRDRDVPHRAVAHASVARDWELVGDIVDAHWIPLVTMHPYELREAMRDMPDEAMGSRIRLRAAKRVAMAVPAGTGPLLAAFKPGAPQLPDLARGGGLRDALAVGTAQAIALRTTGELAASCRLLDQVDAVMLGVDKNNRDDIGDLLPVLQLQWAVCRFLHGDLLKATRDFSRAYAGARGAAGFAARNGAAALALIAALDGDLRRASWWLDREQEHPLEESWFSDAVRTWGDAARCIVAVDRLDAGMAAGTAAVTSGIRRDELWSVVAFAGAQYALAFGDPLTELNRLTSADRFWQAQRRERGLGTVLTASAATDLLLALGLGNRARDVLREAGEHPLLDVGRARLDLLTGGYAAARLRAADLIWRPEADYRTRMAMLLIDATAALRQGDEEAAREGTKRALSMAGVTGALRPFASVPRGDLEKLAVLAPDAESVLSRLSGSGARDPFPVRVELVELTDREQVVLEQLAETSSVEETAHRLVVSANTVKSQRRSLYRKLNARTRDEALATARRLGLLS